MQSCAQDCIRPNQTSEKCTIIRNTGHHTACIHHMRAFFSFLKRHQPDKTILRLKSQINTFRKVLI